MGAGGTVEGKKNETHMSNARRRGDASALRNAHSPSLRDLRGCLEDRRSPGVQGDPVSHKITFCKSVAKTQKEALGR